MSNEIITFSKQSAVSQDIDIEHLQEFESLMRRIITSERDILYEDQREEQKAVILDIYQRQFYISSNRSSIPSIRDILDEVEEYNNELLTELAMLDMTYGKWCPRYSHEEEASYFLSSCGSDEVGEETIFGSFFNAWLEEYWNDFQYSTPYFVADILNENHVCYTIDDNQYKYFLCDLSGESSLCINDAQNVLLPNWHLALITGKYHGDFFYTSKDINDLLNVQIVQK
mgnify:FL=1